MMRRALPEIVSLASPRTLVVVAIALGAFQGIT